MSEKKLRLSIQPTYDQRETGERYSITTFVAGSKLSETKLPDPFVRHTVRVSFWDAIKSLLRTGHVEVYIRIDGDVEIIEDIMELDSNYIGHGSTRHREFHQSIEHALEDHVSE